MSQTRSARQPGEFRAFAEDLAALAGATVREQIAHPPVELKSDGSPVTAVDLAVERVLRERIDAVYPGHGVLGEEYGSRDLEAEWVWVVDPIDGTRQFAAGLPNYGILIALCQHGRPLLGVICQPLLGDVYLGIAGQGAWLNGVPIRTRTTARLADSIVCISDPDCFRGATADGFEALRRGSRWNVYDGGCLGFGALAAGRLDLCLCGPNLDPFDICALVPVVEGAGGLITDWQGNPLTLTSKGAIVATCSAELHAEALEILAQSRE
ncbi:MAG: phosphatase [Proteobacteria bacterium]|nr:phosphatase [Pseudomonadota bacterium]